MVAYIQTEREREVVRFALAYLSANIDDFMANWPSYFADSSIRLETYPLLTAQAPDGAEVEELYDHIKNGGQR